MAIDSLLVLDPAIRDWVVLPMVLVVVLVGMGRHYVQTLIKTTPVLTEHDLLEIRCKQTLQQAGRLRAHGQYVHSNSFQKRKAYFIRKKTGALREKCPPPSNPMSNPMAMVDMMKGNVIFMLPNFAMMGFVSSFFSGFVVLKIPFPMPSTRFKLMLQRGVDLQSLDVSYVSSLSWYFLVTFGLTGVYKLILGDDVDLDDTKMMQKQVRNCCMSFSKACMWIVKLIYACVYIFGLYCLFRCLWECLDNQVLMEMLLSKQRERFWGS